MQIPKNLSSNEALRNAKNAIAGWSQALYLSEEMQENSPYYPYFSLANEIASLKMDESGVAMLCLAEIHGHGWCVEMDEKVATQYYAAASLKGNLEAYAGYCHFIMSRDQSDSGTQAALKIAQLGIKNGAPGCKKIANDILSLDEDLGEDPDN